MSRISRRAAIGIKVIKAPSVKRTSGKASRVTAHVITEPRVIDRASHKRFVMNVFSIRGKSSVIS